MKFQIVAGSRPSHRYFWRIIGDDGDVIAESTTPFPSKKACERALHQVIDATQSAAIEDLTVDPHGVSLDLRGPAL